MSMIKIFANPQIWGVLVMAVGLKIVGFGIKLRRGKYFSARIYGYIEKTMKSGEITYTPLVTVYMDGENKILPLTLENSSKMEYEIGQPIDVVYLKDKTAVYLTGFPYIRLGAVISALGVFLSVGFVILNNFIDKAADGFINKYKWRAVIGFLACAGLFAYGLSTLKKRLRYLKNGVKADAEVGGYVKDDVAHFRPVAVFSYNGKNFSMPANRRQNKPEFEVGKKIKILYDKNQKEVYIYDSHDIIEAVISFIAGTITFAAVFFYMTVNL